MICILCGPKKRCTSNPITDFHWHMLQSLCLISVSQKYSCSADISLCPTCDYNIQNSYFNILVEEAKKEQIHLQLEKEQLEKLVKQMQINLQNSNKNDNTTMTSQVVKMEDEQVTNDEFAEIEEFYWDTNDPGIAFNTNQAYEVEFNKPVNELYDSIEDYITGYRIELLEAKSEQSAAVKLDNNTDDIIILSDTDDIQPADRTALENYANAALWQLKQNNCHKSVDLNNLLNKINSKLYTCRLCTFSKEYHYRSTVMHHIKSLHFGLRYVCPVCDRTFAELRSHYLHHHSMQFPKNINIVLYDQPVIFQDYSEVKQKRTRYSKKTETVHGSNSCQEFQNNRVMEI